VPIQQEITFAQDADLPAIRACVDVLLLLGRAVRLHFYDLINAQDADGPPSPYEVLCVLADILFREMQEKNITDITHTLSVWKQFAGSLTVQRLGGPSSRVIRAIGRRVEADAVRDNAGIGMNLLWSANLRATRWIGESLPPHLPGVDFKRAPMVIDYDEAGTQFCASSSRLHGEIHWTLQPFRHNLFGAMVVPHILEHEYISHLIPRNPLLSQGVREVFLVEALAEQHRDDVEDVRNKNVDMKLDGWFRCLLEEHFCRVGRSTRASLRDYEGVAIRMRRRSKPEFWKMTAEILRLPEDGDANTVDRVVRLLRSLPDSVCDDLTMPWISFAECWNSAQGNRFK
jgi:hypothetical protein